MKAFDFTQPGGFPLTQERLDYMQQAYTEAINALAAVGGDIAGPMVVSGMAVSEPAPGDVTVADGWFMYNGELIKFTGSTVTPGGGEVALVLIDEGATQLAYYNGSEPFVVLEKTATLMAGATVTDATHFPVSALAPFGREKEWTHIVVSASGDGGGGSDWIVTGDIYYKKCGISGLLYIKGSLATVEATFFPVYGTEDFLEMDELPIGYRPATDQLFTANVTEVGIVPNGVTDDQYLKHLRCKVDTSGKIRVEWQEYGDVGGLDDGAYSCSFTAVLFLD